MIFNKLNSNLQIKYNSRMINLKIITLGILLLLSLPLFSQTYPNNEDSEYQDMLTPIYYNSANGDDFRNEINKFFHFARLEPFQHPFKNVSGEITPYSVHRGFGDEISQNNYVVQHHAAIDMYINNGEETTMFAAIDGSVITYKDAPKYRDYLTITKNIEDSVGNIIGKIVVLYGHIDLNLDELDGRYLNGQSVNKGDTISKHLYSETVGGPHLHFEIRYYRPTDVGNEDYYGWSGGSTSYTEPSSGPWTYGFWDTNYGYGFANPENHWNYLPTRIKNLEINNLISIFPNPASNYLNIEVLNNNKSTVYIVDITGKEIVCENFINIIQLNIENLQKGEYLIKIINGNKLVTKKIIKL